MHRKETHCRKLSDSVAIQILDLEAEIDTNRSPELVHELLDLYTQAVEYYSSQADSKYLHYHKRIQSLLAMAEDQKIFGKPPNDKESKHMKTAYYTEVEHTLNQFFTNSSTSSNQAKDDLAKQDSLQNRITQRKSKTLLLYPSTQCFDKKI